MIAGIVFTLVATLGACGHPLQQIASTDDALKSMVAILAKIQQSDYEGDRAELKRLHDRLAPFAEDKELGSRVQYWRGFALWRRAINGFNENVQPAEQQSDLRQALAEFDDSASRDPDFGDAKIAALSCVSLIGASVRMSTKDPTQMQSSLAEWRQRRIDAEKAAPQNPRLFWVLGQDMPYIPPEHGGGEEKAISMYEKGLELIRDPGARSKNPLDPAWGEPELLMNLAYANLHRATPDLAAAERYAHDALALVPYWHYVRDILVPRIRAARRTNAEAAQ